MKRLLITIGSILVLFSAGAGTYAALRIIDESTLPADSLPADAPDMTASVYASGFAHPWDIEFLPDETMLVSERSGSLSLLSAGSRIRTTIDAPPDVKASGEGGMMGISVDPEFERNSYIYTCYNTTEGDIKVVRWELADASLSARKDIIIGIPANESGRHSGCQVAFGPDGNLWIGTGDAADASHPQNRRSLGGKILRVTPDGDAPFDNPEGPDKRVYSYGHRNVQSLVFYPATRNMSYGLSIEHGPDKDDEVNQLVPGNFGWAPGSGYDESVSMTDTAKFPNAEKSVWSSGAPTIAASGAALLRGSEWGRLEGWLVVAALKDQKLKLLNIENGSVGGEREEFAGTYGRLRAATMGPNNLLYLSTDNGSDDKILQIRPSASAG